MRNDIVARLEKTFTPNQARAIAFEVETAIQQQIKVSDFTELKELVRDIAAIQKRTEVKVEELAEAQKRTEVKVEELAEVQKRTEAEIRQLAQAQKNTQQEVGGIANTLGYMLENEAYRHVPKVLAEKYKIKVSDKMIRQQIGNEEINLLAEGTRNRKPVLIVGESKNRLAANDLTQLKKKIKEVEKHDPRAGHREIVPVMVVHFARQKELKRAEQEGVIVIQSFEW